MNHLHSDEIPDQPGSYALLLHLDHPLHLAVGKFGSFNFPTADYLYFGSAQGPGGLRARLKHYLSSDGRPRWHVDSLRSVAILEAIYFTSTPQHTLKSSNRLECTWSQAIARLPSAFIPAPHFGASDCQQKCPAHLIGLSSLPISLKGELIRAVGEDHATLVTIHIHR